MNKITGGSCKVLMPPKAGDVGVIVLRVKDRVTVVFGNEDSSSIMETASSANGVDSMQEFAETLKEAADNAAKWAEENDDE